MILERIHKTNYGTALRRCCLSMLALAVLTSPTAHAADVGPDVTANLTAAPERIEEIVVHARKRAELLEETPVALTAISSTTLVEAGVTQLSQIQQLVPNLQIISSDSGQEAQIKIRGVGTSAPEIAYDPGVGVYIDGVFLPRAIGTLIDVVDLQQIEVLRGPQGTLFGKNTVGGAINITSVRPREELEGFVFLRTGNLGTIGTRAMLNVPISIGPLEDKVFTRLAIATNTTAGYDDVEVFLAPDQDSGPEQTWSDRNSISFLGSLRILPIDDLTIDISGSWSRDYSHGGAAQCVLVQETGLQAFYPGFAEGCAESAEDPRHFQANVDQLTDTKSYGVWGTALWEIGDLGPLEGLGLKYIGSWREQQLRLRMDNDGTAFPIVQISDTGGGGVLDGAPGLQSQIQQELQVNGRVWDRLDFVAGYFVFWEKAHDNRLVASALGTIDFIVENATQTDNWTWAFFTQGTLEVTPWMDLTAGVRYSEDKKGLSQQNFYPNSPDTPPQTDGPERAIFSAWTPMANVSFLAPKDLLGDSEIDSALAYFNYSRGFKGGGFNGVLNPEAIYLGKFEPEYLDSFEIGTKTVALDRRLTVNLAFFYGLYDNIQTLALVDITEEGAALPSQHLVTLNAAEATTYGAELEILAKPIDDLQLTGTVGYVHTEYDEFDEAINDMTGEAFYDRSGESFNSTPTLQTHVSVQYSFELPNGWLTPRLDWYYQSAVHYAGPEVSDTNQTGYNLLHARLSYNFLEDRAQVALWGQNLTDQTYARWAMASTVPSWGNATRFYGAPRTFGAELSYRF